MIVVPFAKIVIVKFYLYFRNDPGQHLLCQKVDFHMIFCAFIFALSSPAQHQVAAAVCWQTTESSFTDRKPCQIGQKQFIVLLCCQFDGERTLPVEFKCKVSIAGITVFDPLGRLFAPDSKAVAFDI